VYYRLAWTRAILNTYCALWFRHASQHNPLDITPSYEKQHPAFKD